jgi:hypothetical protein
MNEPHPDHIIDTGLENFTRAAREVRDVLKKHDPKALVTFSHASWNEFLDHGLWDVVFFNNYMYAPNTVSKSMHYRGHVEWLRKNHATDKPFVLGEYGLAVSPSGEGNLGYGGNTLEEQAEGDLYMYRSMIDAGGQGGCLFMWRDGWWKYTDRNRHDDHAEEWYGILGVEDEDSDQLGTPRPVYYAYQQYNRLIVTEPRQMAAYESDVPIEAYVMEDVTKLSYRVDGGGWRTCVRKGGKWLAGSVRGLTPGRHVIDVVAEGRAADSGADLFPIRRKIDVIVAGNPKKDLPTISITTDKPVYDYGDTLQVQVRASRNGKLLAGVALTGTYKDHYSKLGRLFEGKTDENGTLTRAFPLFVKPTFITLAVGADVDIHGGVRRLSDALVVEVTGPAIRDIEEAAANPGSPVMGFEFENDENLKRAVGRVLAGKAKYAVGREADRTRAGGSALAIELEPEGRHSWGYAELFLDSPRDLSETKAVSYWLHGDGSGAHLKLMLIDKDGERWYDAAVKSDFRGWRRIVFSPKTVQRDPYDGISDGDGRPNTDRIKGLAFVVNSEHERNTEVVVDSISSHK